MNDADAPRVVVDSTANGSRDIGAEMIPVLDQPVSSASNFALNTLVARSSTPGSFAMFTVASTVYVVVQGVLRGGVHLPRLAQGKRAGDRNATPLVLWRIGIVSACAGALAGTVLLFAHSVAGALVCFFLPVVLLQDAQRFGAFLIRRDGDALMADGLWLIVTVGLIMAWLAVGGSVTPVVATTAWLAGAVASVALFVRRRYAPKRSTAQPGSPISPHSFTLGGLEFLLAASVTYGVPLIAATRYGADGVASMRASLIFFAPCLAMLPGLHTPAIRLLSRAGAHEQRRVQQVITGVVMVGVGALVGVMIAARGVLGPMLLGGLWTATAPLIVPAGCFTVARFLEIPAYGMARVRKRTGSMLILRAVTSAVSIAAFCAAMIFGLSLLVAYWVLAVAAIACALGAHAIRLEADGIAAPVRVPLLLGHFGGRNAGDEAILDSTCHLLASTGADVVRLVTRRTDYEPRVTAAVRVEVVVASPAAVVRAVMQSSTVVLCGGTHFNDDFALARRVRHYRYLGLYLAVIAVARCANRPVLALGQGIGPLVHPVGRGLTRVLFKLARSGTVRDDASLRRARALAANPNAWRRTYDTTAFGPEHLRAAGDARDALGIAPVFGAAPEVWDMCAEVIAETWGEHALRRIDVLVFRTGDREDDQALADQLATRLDDIAPVRLTPFTDDVGALIEVLGRTRVVLCGRYHAMVLALQAGAVPVVLPAHRKLVDTAEMLQLPEALIVREASKDALSAAVRAAMEFDPRTLRPILDDLRQSLMYDQELVAQDVAVR